MAVAVLTVAFGWLWRVNAEQPPAREVIIRNEAGDMLGQVRTRPARVPGQGLEFQVAMNDGSTLIVQLPPRPRRPGEGPPRPGLVPRARAACCGSWASWRWRWPSAPTRSSAG